MGKKIVVALGHSALGKTFPEQYPGRYDTFCNERVQPS